ncbi:MAG TPA: ATP-binding protein [Candidatus Pelagibacter bacterium]|jgi:two-component system osmolarity sensor histidine kinase EnvZ|nr:ATP-binding protein [Candidatus Pelagibacter bacterium]
MFYGLSKFIKNLLPKRLFYRGLLIVAVPIVVLQVIITLVFFDSLWIKTNKGMTKSLVSEIVTIIDIYNNESEYNKKIVTDLYNKNFSFTVRFLKNEKLPDIKVERWFSPMDRSLRRELKPKINRYWFNTMAYEEIVDLRIKFRDGILQIFFPKERIQASSIRIFALWITLPAILMITIAIIFLKNQTRPITKLAEASEKFGRGEDIEEFRPSGALEIRKAGLEFNKMRNRILRHLNQRSEMLSGISHDLRTPLTRIKLQLTMIKDNNLSKKLSEDIDEMEKMLSEYLQFASSGAKEKSGTFDLSELVENIINKYENPNISKNYNKRIYFNGRKNLIQRCINNLIDNSIKYGENINLIIEKKVSNIVISIEDDGPGIPESEYENVIKPFYKIDKSRSESKSSVGLGLAISSDIIKSHGGDINFSKSNLGGLKVMISLPV